MQTILFLFIGSVFGFLIAYFVMPKKTDLDRREIDKYRFDSISLQSKVIDLKQALEQAEAENKDYIAKLASANEKLNSFNSIKTQMTDEFKLIANDLLNAQKQSVVLEQTKTINPVKEQMEKMTCEFNKQIQNIIVKFVENKTSLEEQIKNMMDSSLALKKEAADLTDALRGKKKLQGNWGEIQVERLFEILGWQVGVQFDIQKHLSDGHDIPDYIVHMPGDKHFVVDAKMSLNSYMDYLATDNLTEKTKYWNVFVDATKQHIKELGAKNYNKVVDKKFDYVCMFMPLEHAYIELMNRNKEDLYKYAYDNGVTIATPSLLLPMLRTIDTLMNVEKQSKNVEDIVKYAERLYEKYAGFTEDYKRIGLSLEAMKKTYDEGMGKLVSGRGSISGWFEKIKRHGGLSVTKHLALCSDNNGDDDE